MIMDSESNRQLELAREYVEQTGVNLFLTGKAGTGKTTFLRRLCALTSKRVVVAAPTGIAAINAGGVTLHSLFQLPFGVYIPGMTQTARRYDRFSRAKLRVIRSMDLLVIDEVSMVRADLLDAVDASLRRHRDATRPFGGVQLLLIGDLAQLAPVVTPAEQAMLGEVYGSPYFFESKALNRAGYRVVELDKVYRQSDTRFVELLNSVRDGHADASTLARLNERCHPGFVPPPDAGYIRLTTHNNRAREINDRELESLPGRSVVYRAVVQGEFAEQSYPADEQLRLRQGAQVMFVKNDPDPRHRYYNGMIGSVTALGPDFVTVQPADRSLPPVMVQAATWECTAYRLNDTTRQLEQHVTGVFRQIPLRAAWAITIHKSQGLTFDHAIIDAASAFAHGQTYVALSRCRSLEGMVLERPLTRSSIIADEVVTGYVRDSRMAMPDEGDLAACRSAYRLALLNDMFDFSPLGHALDSTYRVVSDAFHNIDPDTVGAYREVTIAFDGEFRSVASRFALQYTALSQADDPALHLRVNAAAAYFSGKLTGLRRLFDRTCRTHDNKAIAARLDRSLADMEMQLCVKEALMRELSSGQFTVIRYLRTKADAMVDMDKEPAGRKRAARAQGQTSPVRRVAHNADGDVSGTPLHQALTDWRRRQMTAEGKPAYVILSNRAIEGICRHRPGNLGELRDVPGIGPATIERYGTALLAIVAGN